MILIDGLYINKGGGAVLLQYLITEILQRSEANNFFFLLDPRFEKPAELTGNYEVIPNKMSARIRFYKQNRKRFTTVFCFANTPPPVKMLVPAYTYMHNQKLLEAPFRKWEPMFRSQYIKYLVMKLYNNNTDSYIVQTPHMVEMLVKTGLKKAADCLTIPFYDNRKYAGGGKPFTERMQDEFVFISNPSPQKNYPTLLQAWELLLSQGYTPRLHVTIDETGAELRNKVAELNVKGAQIINHEYLDPKELYFNCAWLIFPSLMESFGLPLIEAADSGMKILASDLPYVYDVVKPSLVFDQNNAASIADAVQQAISDPNLPFPEIVTKNEVQQLINILTGKR